MPRRMMVRASGDKPGVCPPEPGKTVCLFGRSGCTSDANCVGDLKCCDWGCRRECKKPEELTLRTRHKPGVCPDISKQIVFCGRNELQDCDVDKDCAPREKCCPHRCGRTCQVPVSPPFKKPGVCPRASELVVPCNQHLPLPCVTDIDCPFDLKCCKNGCGRNMCTGPGKEEIGEREGVCPDDGGIITSCGMTAENCFADSECSPGLKCCKHGCGSICKFPLAASYNG
ncbi:WAP four-disulfide core domain protein 2-like isoform X2 [Oratosquilla oratoria]|uniref:WAP four-disulfide core domain protein 2-like isoform X2 n=1 Tax=Oratosquilla oratoria TaxID=337810 RepID=UPI003F776CE6